eukprot:jgi/Botrbrau1/6716/Bobra.0324s0007.1
MMRSEMLVWETGTVRVYLYSSRVLPRYLCQHVPSQEVYRHFFWPLVLARPKGQCRKHALL